MSGWLQNQEEVLRWRRLKAAVDRRYQSVVRQNTPMGYAHSQACRIGGIHMGGPASISAVFPCPCGGDSIVDAEMRVKEFRRKS